MSESFLSVSERPSEKSPRADEPSSAGRRTNRHFGIRDKMLAAFGLVAAMAVVSAGVALWSYGKIGDQLEGIAGKSVPALMITQRLAEEVSRLTAGGPALSASETKQAQEAATERLRQGGERLRAQIGHLRSTREETEQTDALQDVAGKLVDKLTRLSKLVADRIQGWARTSKLIAEIATTHEALLTELAPLAREASETVRNSPTQTRAATNAILNQLTNEALSDLVAVMDARMAMNEAIQVLVSGANTPEQDQVNDRRQSFARNISTVTLGLKGVGERVNVAKASKKVSRVIEIGAGENNIFDDRLRMLEQASSPEMKAAASARIRKAVAEVSELDGDLRKQFDVLVLKSRAALIRLAENLRAQTDQALTDMVDIGVLKIETLSRAAATVNLMVGVLNEAASTGSEERLGQLKKRFEENAALLVNGASALPPGPETDGLKLLIERLNAAGGGENGLFALRQTILTSDKNIREAVAEGFSMAERLGGLAQGVVDHVRQNTDIASRHAQDAIDDARGLLLLIAAVSVAGAGLIVRFFVVAKIVTPVRALTRVMSRLAQGDLDVAAPDIATRDEIQEIAQTVAVFKSNAVERQSLVANERREAARNQERQKQLTRDTDQFGEIASKAMSEVANLVQRLSAVSDTLNGNAQQTEKQSNDALQRIRNTSSNVSAVSAASSQLSSSIDEISRQVTEGANISGAVEREALETNQKVENLVSAVRNIGDMTSMIHNIASQTNLLALNATIEAARAGDAGRGFAVVATEVKQLANQTAQATETISSQINNIQTETAATVDAIRGITSTISRLREMSTAIASAVEEQSAATNEIARNAEEAVTRTRELLDNVGEVATAATETGRTADLVLRSATELRQESFSLNRGIDEFLTKVHQQY